MTRGVSAIGRQQPRLTGGGSSRSCLAHLTGKRVWGWAGAGDPVVQQDRAVGPVCGPSLMYGYAGLIVETTRFGGLATVMLYHP